ncbi:MAG: peptide chain release factor 1 [Desulfurococcales archaeon]|jgi:peptide chain release factor subunit 1|uniref:Peptide chain release factor subunit 1 n=1 Tax=Fervidicoccus fontis TaxID=683846 RepID=A0A7J3SLM3_9CREN|nr:peptide chain release factor aRF-1 [Thermoprotei archaeon]NAY89651.1 peptide chain release factor 1 [Desulfurococcales archaeon]
MSYQVSKEQLKALVKELKQWKAPATTLLSLYIPPGRPVSDVVNMLRTELSITDNIKLKRTKDAVQTSLSMAIDRLTNLTKIPENGLVLFCGMNSDNGKQICMMFSPPEPVKIYYYRTDKWFHTEFLEDMISEKSYYGLIIIERDEATIGLLKGTSIEVLDNFMSYIPGKHTKGGQSQRRFDRIIEQMVEDFYKTVAERAKQLFEPLLLEGKLKGILVGGPGYSKQDFVSGEYLDKRLRDLVIDKLIDVGYQDEAGLRELVIKASDILQDHRYSDAFKKVEELKYHMAKADGLTAFGYEEIKQAAEMGALQTILVVEDHPLLDELESLGKKAGAEIVIVPLNSPEGEWLQNSFEGIAGILRYKIF